MKKNLLFLFIIIPAFAFSQSPEEAAVPTPGMESGQDPNAAIPPPPLELGSPEMASSIEAYLSPFRYEGDHLRNPFIPPELAIPLQPGDVYGPFLPLQSYKLSEMTVNGLFWNTSKPKAIIATPDGKKFGIGIKDYIGENFGYVASIREKEIVIIQTLEERGQRFSTTKVLFLNQKRREQ